MRILKLTLLTIAFSGSISANAQIGGLLEGISNELEKASQGVLPKQEPQVVPPNQESQVVLPQQEPQGAQNPVPRQRQAMPSSEAGLDDKVDELASNYCSKLKSSEVAKKMSGLMSYSLNNSDSMIYPSINGGRGFDKNSEPMIRWVEGKIRKEIPQADNRHYTKLSQEINKCFKENIDDKIYLLSQAWNFNTLNGVKKGADVFNRDIPKEKLGSLDPRSISWQPGSGRVREWFLYGFLFDGFNEFLAQLDPNPVTALETEVTKEVAEFKAKQPVPIADFKKKWCQNVDKSTISPVEFRDIRTGDGCLLPDAVIVATLKKIKEARIDVMNLQAPIVYQLQNIEAGELKFPLIKLVFAPRDNKFYVGLFNALICPASELNSLSESNSFRTALEAKYGKPSSVLTEYAKFKAQVDAAERMIADQKKKIVTVGDAKAVREGEQQVNILKNMLSGMDQKTPGQLNWEYDAKNRVQDETGFIVARLNNNDVSGDIRCEGAIPSAFMVQVGGTSSLQAVFKKVASDARQNEANKEKNAPTPKF
jgi:hypothetical protein